MIGSRRTLGSPGFIVLLPFFECDSISTRGKMTVKIDHKEICYILNVRGEVPSDLPAQSHQHEQTSAHAETSKTVTRSPSNAFATRMLLERDNTIGFPHMLLFSREELAESK